MGRQAKPAAILKLDNGHNRKTKAELALREKAEQAQLFGYPINESDEVRTDPVAHAEFQHITTILSTIGKNDEVYGASIRRYCIVTSKLAANEKTIKTLRRKTDRTSDLELRLKAEAEIDRKDNKSAAYRKELLELERETGLTLASSLRLIPKKPEKAKDPLLEILSG